MWVAVLILLPAVASAALLGAAPARKMPQGFRASLLHPSQWPFSLIPVPEVATDPNSGTTIGVLPVFLFTDEHHQIRQILAPDIAYNTILGATGNFRFLAYPSSDTQWYVIGGGSQDIARRVDLLYSTGRDRTRWWSFDGRFYFERDPTERFFGLGNFSPHAAQSNYTTEQLYVRAKLGINFTHELQFALIEKPWRVRIQPGALTNLPYTANAFPTLKGLNGGTEVLTRVVLSYDTRDSIDIPHHGGLYRIFYSVADRAFLSSNSYNEFGFEVRHYFHLNDRMILATHAYLQYIPAESETPFWAMSRLGGQESVLFGQQTLRGYGAGRFIDNNMTDLNAELRTRVWSLDVFGTHGTIELAPFVDLGKVFHDIRTDPINQLHPTGGIGFRGIAEPFVVGFVDVGFGSEGAAIFSGINYPF